jgi:Protein of unknown function (DUF2510)
VLLRRRRDDQFQMDGCIDANAFRGFNNRRANRVILAVQPGWYPDPEGPGQRYWDGQAWGPRAPQPSTYIPPFHLAATFRPQEKSSGVAVLLTVLWPGAGHLYLGLTQKALPYFVANAIGVVFALSIYLSPIAMLIWLVTLCMTVGSVTQETNQVNDALRRGHRISG